MFKRTKNYGDGQYDAILERAGVQGENAFTNNDYTAYIQELPKKHLETIIKLESDRMVNLIVDDEAFRTEREVVQNERRMRTENNPDGLIYQELHHIAFTQHPYHWPVIGYEEDLNRMTAKDAEAFYKKFYHPGRATVVVVGDVDPFETYELVKKYYGEVPSKELTPDNITPEPEQLNPRRSTLRLNVQVEKLALGFPVPGNKHVDTPVLDVIEGLLSKGRASRLERALVDTGVATDAECSSNSAVDSGLFSCYVSLQDKKSASVAEKIILNELSKLASVPVTEAELKRTKNLILFGIYNSLTENHSKAQWLGSLETQYGRFETGVRLTDEIMKATPKDIQRVAGQYFRPERRNVVMGVPK
jgi:zinc protease